LSSFNKNINSNSNSNINNKIKTNTIKKQITSKRIFNFPSKKSMKSNLKKTNNNNNNSSISNTNSNINNNNKNTNANNTTLEDIKNNTVDNINKEEPTFKRKSVKFKQEDTSEIEMKICFTSSGEENNGGSLFNKLNNKNSKKKKTSKFLNSSGKSLGFNTSENISDALSKGNSNNENISSENGSIIIKKEKLKPKKIISKKIYKENNINKKTKINKDTINSKNTPKVEKKDKEKEKEFAKILKEMNEDYNHDIEMLQNQEEQIKLMLSLIDLNDE
jgi:hypothetical protein